MPDFRAFGAYSPGQALLALSREESHHLVVVNRARRGAEVVVFNGHGTEWLCTLEEESKNNSRLLVRETRQHPPLPFQITLAQALPKGTHMDDIVRKATEIGAREIIPLSTERTQVHLDEDRSDRKQQKWETAALEAAKQCGNPWLPRIAPVTSFSELLQRANDWEFRLIASLQTGAVGLAGELEAFRSRHGRPPRSALWLIGPEGDFSPKEAQAATAAGFLPITLGPLVLRCETAATYALSVLSYELQKA